MCFVKLMNEVLCQYGLWVRETKNPEPMRFAIMSPSGPLAYLSNEGEVTAYISALYSFRKGDVPIRKD